MPMIKTMNQTGYKNESPVNTATALIAADFAGNIMAELIQPKVEVENVSTSGQVGNSFNVSGKKWGELPSLTEYVQTVANGRYSALFKAAGGVVTAGSPNVISFGGSQFGTANGYSGTFQGAIAKDSLSVEQYDGLRKRTLSKAHPTKLTLSAENGKPIKIEASLIGIYSESASAIPFTAVPGSGTVIKALGSTLTIGGTSLSWKDIEIDFGPEVKEYADASASTGIDHYEQVDQNIKITVTINTPTKAVYDYLTAITSDTASDLIWTSGMGAWKGKVYVSSTDEVYQDGLGNVKIVYDVAYNSAKNYSLALEY